ncbi:MAG: hypothetical protein HY814_13315 [Candidatus Riflebacteria bacterium]|nr:hypothetical protein [Candidatus Riflebacteria bacterium]
MKLAAHTPLGLLAGLVFAAVPAQAVWAAPSSSTVAAPPREVLAVYHRLKEGLDFTSAEGRLRQLSDKTLGAADRAWCGYYLAVMQYAKGDERWRNSIESATRSRPDLLLEVLRSPDFRGHFNRTLLGAALASVGQQEPPLLEEVVFSPARSRFFDSRSLSDAFEFLEGQASTPGLDGTTSVKLHPPPGLPTAVVRLRGTPGVPFRFTVERADDVEDASVEATLSTTRSNMRLVAASAGLTRATTMVWFSEATAALVRLSLDEGSRASTWRMQFERLGWLVVESDPPAVPLAGPAWLNAGTRTPYTTALPGGGTIWAFSIGPAGFTTRTSASITEGRTTVVKVALPGQVLARASEQDWSLRFDPPVVQGLAVSGLAAPAMTVPRGTYNLTATKPGFLPKAQSVQVVPCATASVAFVLKPDEAPPSPVCQIASAPPGKTDGVRGTVQPGARVCIRERSADGTVLATLAAPMGSFELDLGDNMVASVAVSALSTTGRESEYVTFANDVERPAAASIETVAQNAPRQSDWIAGHAEAKARVDLRPEAAGATTLSTMVAADGRYRIDLGDNRIGRFTVSVTDAAGNESEGTTGANDIDPPPAPSAVAAVLPQGGRGWTLTGSAERGSTVQIRAADSEAAPLVTTQATDGAFRVTLAEGPFTRVSLNATDRAGNRSGLADVSVPPLPPPPPETAIASLEVTVNGRPALAGEVQVFVDDRQQVTIPADWRLTLPPGEHSFQARKGTSASDSARLELPAKLTRTVSLAIVEPGVLTLAVRQDGAAVSEGLLARVNGGKEAAPDGAGRLQLRPGRYRIEVRAGPAGEWSPSREVEIAAGSESRLEVELPPTMGTMRVEVTRGTESVTAGVLVRLNNGAEMPFPEGGRFEKLTPGSYQVEARLADEREWTAAPTARVVAGRETRVTVSVLVPPGTLRVLVTQDGREVTTGVFVRLDRGKAQTLPEGGRFEKLPPGSYRVEVRIGTDGEWAAASELARVASGAETQVAIALQSRATLVVIVKRGEQPLSRNLWVTVNEGPARSLPARGLVLSAGTHRVRVREGQSGPWTPVPDVVLTAGARMEREVVLPIEDGTLVAIVKRGEETLATNLFVSLDGGKRRQIPPGGRLKLPAGSHEVRVCEGQGPWSPTRTVSIEVAKDSREEFEVPGPEKGTLIVVARRGDQPVTSNLYIGVDQTDARRLSSDGRLQLDAGSHRVRVREGRGEWSETRTVTIDPGQEKNETFELAAVAAATSASSGTAAVAGAGECTMNQSFNLPANGRTVFKLPCNGGNFKLSVTSSSEVDVFVVPSGQARSAMSWQKGDANPVGGAIAQSTENRSANLTFNLPRGDTFYVIVDDSIFPGDRGEGMFVAANGTVQCSPQ